jgi:uncharacterized protein YgiM (DUF1202 family)
MSKYIILHIFLFAFIFIVNGCTSAKKGGDQHLQDSIYQLELQNQQFDLELKRLQKELTAKQIKIEQLTLERQQATQQVVRTKTKLRSHHSKAGIVVHLAEVKTLLNSLSEKPMDPPQQQKMQEAEQLIINSEKALNREDIETASSLSNKAQQILIPLLSMQTKNPTKLNVAFATPLSMVIKKECNVRNAPGMSSKVLFTMDAGSKVKALAFVKNWINIKTVDQRKGWIYYRLLTLD